MNNSTTTFFKQKIATLQDEYAAIETEITQYVEEHNITSHLQGDKKYYDLCIIKWSIYRKLKRYEAILNNSEFSYLRYHKPVIANKIHQLEMLKANIWEGLA